jgi:uncharacterized RDD family membrane protein YckC
MNPAETTQRGFRDSGAYESRLPGASLAARVKALALTGALIVVTLGIGWFLWTVVEWRRGRTASYSLLGLRVVRSNGDSIGLWRSVMRNAVCCTLLLVPTLIVCALLAFAFVMGASPPNGLLSQPRRAPWDILTDTKVVDQRGESTTRKKTMRLAKWDQQVPLSVN